MKKIIVGCICLSYFLYADISMQEIEHMVQKIHEKREGVKLDTLEQTKEPFVRLMAENNVTKVVIPKKETEKKLSLDAIMNQSAYINDRWIGKDEKILGFTVVYIGKKGVVLQSGNQIKKLFLHEKKSDLITLKEKE